MSAYVIARVQVTDPEQYAEYTQRTPAVIASFGGRFLARGGQTVTLEGPEAEGRIVVLEFDTLEQAVACFRSPAYNEARQYRLGAAETRITCLVPAGDGPRGLRAVHDAFDLGEEPSGEDATGARRETDAEGPAEEAAAVVEAAASEIM